MSLEPLTDYSKFKVDCEKILNESKTSEFQVVTIRPATVCGFSPRQRLDVVVNILTNLGFFKKEITVFGGEQLRSNIHILDMVRSYDHILKTDFSKINGEIFNVGFENDTVSNLANTVKEVLGSDITIKKTPSNDNRSYHISSEKIKTLLNFGTKYSIKSAVADLKNAFQAKILTNTFEDIKYYNIKVMNNINLK